MKNSAPVPISRKLRTDLEGRIENLGIGPTHVLQALYEAVSNSLHAIEAARKQGGIIEVEINRDRSQLELPPSSTPGPIPQPDILDIRITDNGEGFTESNMESFLTLDSRAKAGLGGKGVGRLVWLKFFDHVDIESIFKHNGKLRQRRLRFSLTDGVVEEPEETIDSDTEGSRVVLTGLGAEYAKAIRQKSSTICNHILQHFLSVFLTRKMPRITVIDGDSVEAINVSDLPEHSRVELAIGKATFEVIHTRIRSPEERSHAVRFCAGGRVITTERMKQLPNSRFESVNEPFFYQAFVSSDYLDERVNQERTAFLDAKISLLDDVSFSEIREKVHEAANDFLFPLIVNLRDARDARIDKVLEHDMPEYQYVKELNPEDLSALPLDASEAAIEDTVSRLHFRNQRSGRKLLQSVVEDVRSKASFDATKFSESFEKEFRRASRISQASLFSYMLFRKSVIDIFRELLSKKDDRFQVEASVHELMFPMGKDIAPDRAFLEHNLWLIDERLTYASYIASDRPLKEHKILFSVSDKDEPDVVAYFNLGFSSDALEDGSLRDVVIVEFKRPGPLPHRKEDPYVQVVRYIQKIRSGFYNDQGRKVRASDVTRFFCYIVCDLDNREIDKLKTMYRFEPMFDGKDNGYFLYHPDLRTYMELVPFEKILRAAKRNHRAFFERAGFAWGSTG